MSLTGQTLKQRKDEGIVATTATDTALLITQEQDGSVAKPIELKNLVTDRKDTILGQELPETLSGITLAHNPLRAKPVVANDDNTKAYAGLPVLPSNTAVAVDLKTGTKKSTAVKVAGCLANSISFNFAFKHQSPSVTTARVIANLLLSTDIVKPILILTGNSLVIKDFATVADADTTGVTLATRTLTVGKIYNYVLKYSGDTDGAGIIELYENNISIYKNTSITYNAEYITSVLANVAIEVALEEQWIRKDIFNYTITPAEVSLLWNSGRPDRAVLPEYMKWGDNTKYNSTYAGNEDIDKVAWYDGNAGGTTHPVGQKLPNAAGIYDMSGNVYEWCWDRYASYPTGVNNPTGATTGFLRVLRGGSWNSPAMSCRSAYRSNDYPNYGNGLSGFRLLRRGTPNSTEVQIQAKQAGMQNIGSGTFVDCTIDAFVMSKYQVTQADWASVMAGNVNNIPTTTPYFPNNPTHPMQTIRWYDILVYCNRKSIAEGLTPVYAKAGDTNPDNWGNVPTEVDAEWNAITMNMSANGYRLPTEAEWEWAARQGTVGSVASYTGKGLITDSAGKCTSWETDKKIETGTDDGLTATITGTPDLQLIQAEETEGQGLVDSIYKTITTAPMSANGLIGTVPMGWAIDEVLIEKTAGSTSNSLVIRANSTSGTQIGTCSAIAFADSDDDLYTTAMTKKRLSNTANKDVFVSGISNGAYVVTLRIKKI